MKEQIKNFIIMTFMDGEGNLEDDQSLFESDIIDSLGVIKLLTYIENKFNVHIEIGGITLENFSSINDIEQMIKKTLNK